MQRRRSSKRRSTYLGNPGTPGPGGKTVIRISVEPYGINSIHSISGARRAFKVLGAEGRREGKCPFHSPQAGSPHPTRNPIVFLEDVSPLLHIPTVYLVDGDAQRDERLSGVEKRFGGRTFPFNLDESGQRFLIHAQGVIPCANRSQLPGGEVIRRASSSGCIEFGVDDAPLLVGRISDFDLRVCCNGQAEGQRAVIQADASQRKNESHFSIKYLKGQIAQIAITSKSSKNEEHVQPTSAGRP
jgi:hypothetical protein